MGTSNKPDLTTPVGVIKVLAGALRTMQYADGERSAGEATPAYRNGWNDAMRAAVKHVLGCITVQFVCARGCGWNAHGRGDQEVSRLTARYAHCPQCSAPVDAAEVTL